VGGEKRLQLQLFDQPQMFPPAPLWVRVSIMLPLRKWLNFPMLGGMDVLFFFQVVAAVFLGGLMLAGFLWAGWTSVRLERNGVPQDRLPFRVYLFLAGPPLFMAFMAYLLET